MSTNDVVLQLFEEFFAGRASAESFQEEVLMLVPPIADLVRSGLESKYSVDGGVFIPTESIEPAMCGMIAIALRAKDIFDERNRVGTRHDGEVARHADRGGTGSA
jgi:hypothetical protein